MATTAMKKPWTRDDMRRVADSQRAVKHHQLWWVALGREDGEGLRLGGQWQPWSSWEERDIWRQWSRGGGKGPQCANTLNRIKRLGMDPRKEPLWLINIAQVLYDEVMIANPPTYWDDPNWSPELAYLRWVQLWPWDAKRRGWVVDGGRYRIPAIPAFRPWAAVLPVGEPQAIGAWMDRILDDPLLRSSAVNGLTGPLSIAVLLQTQYLQAVGGGYWDWSAEKMTHA